MLPVRRCAPGSAARLADAMRRDLIVRATLVVRAVRCCVAAAVAVVDGPRLGGRGRHARWRWPWRPRPTPRMVAAMPGVAGAPARRATDLLVTIEVAAFVVGAALGGLLLHPAARAAVPWVPVVMTVVALAARPARCRCRRPTRAPGRAARTSGVRRPARAAGRPSRHRRDGRGQPRGRARRPGPAAAGPRDAGPPTPRATGSPPGCSGSPRSRHPLLRRLGPDARHADAPGARCSPRWVCCCVVPGTRAGLGPGAARPRSGLRRSASRRAPPACCRRRSPTRSAPRSWGSTTP